MTKKGAYIVSWSNEHGEDKAVLIVGNQIKNGKVEVVNAFAGQEAINIYNLLTNVKEKEA